MIDSGRRSDPVEPFEDFPLRPETELEQPSALDAAETAEGARPLGAATLGPRLTAAAADAAVVLLLAALALLGARVLTGAVPRPAGVPWALGFVVYLSLFATVPPLVLFGRTVGMAIADLSARSGDDAAMPASAAARRWSGTLATVATAGLVLLWTRRDPERPTPADRFSGRPLALD
ncbi:MAG TPA: RDD family protein [Thermoanaerobaculia bacterium]|nr:RDD family protein [Thermoanaerobaculia bacterium]